MKKRFLATLAALSVGFALVPMTAQAAEPVAKIGEVSYTSLSAAVTAAKDGETIKLLENITLSATQDTAKNLTIDLNGKTIKGDNVRVFRVDKGTLTLTGSGTLTSVKNTNLNPESSVIRVGHGGPSTPGAGTYDPAALVIGPAVTVEAPNSYALSFFGINSKIDVTIAGKVHSTNTAPVNGTSVSTPAISGNGHTNFRSTKMTVTVKDGAEVTATGAPAIYNPQPDTLNIEGGTIKGTSGIEMKAGTLNISGNPTIVATAPTASWDYNGNGPSSKGYAVAVVEDDGYGGNAKTDINGGEYKGPIDVFAQKPNVSKKGDIDVKSGTFDHPVDKKYIDPAVSEAAVNEGKTGQAFYIGSKDDVAKKVEENGQASDTVTVKQGDASFKNLPEGTVVKNEGQGKVEANGEDVKPGGSTPAPNPNPKPTYSISGIAFLDVNGDGKMDSGEAGTTGVTVTVTTADLTTAAQEVCKVEIKDPSGKYNCDKLHNGKYTVKFADSKGREFTTPDTVKVTIGQKGEVVNVGVKTEPTPTPKPTPEPDIHYVLPGGQHTSSLEANVGEEVTVQLTGLLPNEEVDFYLHSDPIFLGKGVTDAKGAITFKFKVAAGTKLGKHKVIAIQKDKKYELTLLIKSRQIQPPAAPIDSQPGGKTPLASTGVDDMQMLLTLSLLLLVGGAAIVRIRYRQR